MSEASIPFNMGLASGLSELSGMTPIQTNLLVDAAGALRLRPTIGVWADFPTTSPTSAAIIGIYQWRQFVLFVDAHRCIWAWSRSGGIVAISNPFVSTSPPDSTQLDGTGRPIWTYDSQRVVVTGGGQPQQWLGVGLSSRLVASGTAPSGNAITFTHIGYADQRLIGNLNDNTGIFQWSPQGVANHTTWPLTAASGGGFAEAEAAPDPVVALYVNTNEVFVFGTQTLQVYIPDAATEFTPATSVQVGCIAPYSVIDTDGNFAWLDDRMRLVDSGGRNFTALSSPMMATDIASFTTVSDCWGARMRMGSFDLLVWTFPTVGRALVYDRVTKKWAQFQGTDATTGQFVGWNVNCYAYLPDLNLHLVGKSDGTIGTLAFENTSAAPQAVTLRYRDGVGDWHPAVSLSTTSPTAEPVVQSPWAIGMYRQREWEVSWTASSAGEPVVNGVGRTGFVDRGTFAQKLCQRAQLQFRKSGPANEFVLAGATETYMRGPM
jgi:hypothetical protein